MADTKPLAILKAAATNLAVASVTTDASTVITKPSGLAVSRTQARPKEGATLMVVKAADDEPVGMDLEPAGFGRIACTFAFDVVCLKDGDPPEDAVDTLVQWAHAALMDDRTLGGTCKTVYPVGVDYSLMRANDNESAAVVRFRAIYHTAVDDPALGY